MRSFDEHRAAVEARIERWCAAMPANGLHEPMAYLMRLPAKRVRPVSVLMAHELFGGAPEGAMEEALGIELFHNFTLMHDDIMDEAPLRRGRPTVHAKWNTNTAILSGDAMLVRAYMQMGRNARVMELFNRYALEVCEGQQLDMDFERLADVALVEYKEMIRLKTAVLLSCAMQVGAVLAGASESDVQRIGDIGEHLGLAFQLRDDLLDAFGDPDKVGKQVGGDLRAGKKTWLLIRGLEKSQQAGRTELREELTKAPTDRDVPRMIRVLEELAVRAEAEAEVVQHDEAALAGLDAIGTPEANKRPMRELAAMLMVRTH
ncbi:MAG: polyprenyl synthetase family protein [Flavobacteriales bacterium]|nr:polyprenyl synthetase family protein [Flavobacteriales bacterium]